MKLLKKEDVQEDNSFDTVQTSDVRNQKYAKNLSLDVKKIGSSTDGVSIVKYKGKKYCSLKSFRVVKILVHTLTLFTKLNSLMNL